MKDPLPQEDNPYEGPVTLKRQPLIQDMSDTKTVLNAGWVLEKDNAYIQNLYYTPPIHMPTYP